MSIALPQTGSADRARASLSVWHGVRIGLRELSSGLKGFGVFIACLALGVAVIAAVGALSDALKAGFEKQGEAILGGDITYSRMHARVTDPERRVFSSSAQHLSEAATLRTMARKIDGSDQALAELKAVDGAYPLAGELKLSNGAQLSDVLSRGGAAVDPLLLERLGVKPGDSIKIGSADIPVVASIVEEPDSLADRLTYGPRVLMSLDTLERTGLLKPGTLVRWRYAMSLADDSSNGIEAAKKTFADKLPEAGFTIVDKRDPAPQVTRAIERLRQFLTLIGLASLLVGGTGVANSVQTFIDRRLESIATLKSIGATSRQVFAILLTQVMAVALIGIVIGLAIGSLTPLAVDYFFGNALPVKAELAVSTQSIMAAAAYGILVAALFSLWPLGRAEAVQPTVLFRGRLASTAEMTGRRPKFLIAAVGGVAAVLAALAILTSDAKLLAVYVITGLTLTLTIFWALGIAATVLARKVPRPRRPEAALAIGSIGAPDGLARSVILSLGMGLSLLVAVALVDSSMVNELQSRLPEKSPDYFMLDVPKDEYAGLKDKIVAAVPGTQVDSAPMLRGRLVKLKGEPVEKISAPPEAQWVLNGDRGLSYSEDIPPGSKVVEGKWWDAGYSGPPLVSFESDIASKLGLKIGDEVTINVLGRNVTATIANLRELHWESLSINFVMLFSPNTLKAAPHNYLATVSFPEGVVPSDEIAAMREVAKSNPSVSAIRVKDAIAQVNGVLSKIMTAVRVAGSVTLVAGALVLAGALATAQRRRILDAVILTALGATRAKVITAHVIEYLILGVLAASVAIATGTLAAWVAVTFVMDLEFIFSLTAAATAILLALLLVVAFGSAGTFSVLRARPVAYLKSE